MTTALNRKVLLSALAASAVMIATPTLAQNYQGDGYGYGQGNGYGYNNGQGYGREIDQRQARLEQRVYQLASNGRISRSEYRRLDNAFNQFDQVQWSYARNGYSRQEISDLNYRLERLQAAIRSERREGRRDDRWDRNDRDDYRNDRDYRGNRHDRDHDDDD